MYAISNKRMNLLHLREVNDHDEELILISSSSWSLNIFCDASLMTMEDVQIYVNCRSTLSMLAGMMNPLGFSSLFKIL